MAYLRDEKETVEMDFPIDIVWDAIKQVIERLGWIIETVDEKNFSLQAKTKKAFLSYATILTIRTKKVSEKSTQVFVNAETPVTTITSVLDFGKTQERVSSFLYALSSELKEKNSKQEESE